MCGFVGVLGGVALNNETLLEMASMIAHRGPDDEGIWLDQQAKVGLAHRRLAILDLSHEGHQPMISSSGRFIIVFNGEIYNHKSIRTELIAQRAHFKGYSDTEVLLTAVEQWGLKRALTRVAGMFAIALFDRRERQLSLVRDRMGEKPLYYGWQGSGQQQVFLFGSELKALRQHPSWQGGIDRGAVAQLLRYNYIPTPMTIHPKVKKLPPGGLLQLQGDSVGNWRECALEQWWSFNEQIKKGQDTPFDGSDIEAVEVLDSLLKEVIGEQSMADVPVGAFLSGGIDSTSAVAVMQSIIDRPVKSFTIGYDHADYDESANARHIAEYLGTDHNEWILQPQDVIDVITELPNIYDEPFADASQIPTLLVSRFAKQQVTVSLSGDGGDEIFGGYNRYLFGPQLMRKIQPFPLWLKRCAVNGIMSVSPEVWDTLFNRFKFLIPDNYITRQFGEKMYLIARLMEVKSEQEFYMRLVSKWDEPIPLIGGRSQDIVEFNQSVWATGAHFSERMMWTDSITYLPDDILVKVDRAAMSSSLETRMPLLDHRVIEFALRLPIQMKIRNGKGKWVLREVLNRYITKELVEQPKSGFGLPLHQWLRGPLRVWGEDLLAESKLRKEGIFDANKIRKLWNDHLTGKRNNLTQLWSILMFQSWMEK